MSVIGLLHMECDCGAQLYYLDNGTTGPPSAEMLKRFRETLRRGRFVIFTSATGAIGRCSYCHTDYQLPSSSLFENLPVPDVHVLRERIADVMHTERVSLEP